MTTAIHSETDLFWMRRALELARRGIGLCSPNPAVGCVILDRDGALAGEGWHEYDRRDHAEVVALAAAGERAPGGPGRARKLCSQPEWRGWWRRPRIRIHWWRAMGWRSFAKAASRSKWVS